MARTTKKLEWPAASVDIVLLTIRDGKLHVALAPREGKHRHGELALIGGTIHMNEDAHLGETVERILRARGGLEGIFVEQLYTFGSNTRDERGWSVSIAYYGLVPMHRLEMTSKDLKFIPVDALPELPFEHNRIIETAVWRVRGKGGYSTIPARLLPEEFSLTQMLEVYEAVLGKKLDQSSFRRKVQTKELVEPTGNKVILKTEGSKRPSEMFRLRQADGEETFARSL